MVLDIKQISKKVHLVFTDPYRLFRAIRREDRRIDGKQTAVFVAGLSLLAAVFQCCALLKTNLLTDYSQLLPARLLFETG